MTRRHLTTALTLLVLCGLLVAAAVVGFNALFAPLPTDEEPSASASPSCAITSVGKGQRLRSRQVLVNVFNGGDRAGLAGETLDALARRGFRAGEVGNAPADNRVRRVQVWAQPGEEAAARLVALQFGRRTKVATGQPDLAEGVDVVVSNGFRGMAKASRSIRVRDPQQVCLPAPSPAAG